MRSGTPLPDSALVIRARAGEADAREQLAQRVGESAFVFALQLTHSTEDARDIAQDSVLRFFRYLGRFDVSRPVEPWLFGIVRNRVRDLVRRERARREESLDAWLEQRGAEPPGTDDPVATAERHELQRRVWSAISELGEAHREILVLRDHHGLAYHELAEVLSIPAGTVMSRLHAARRRLRQILLEQERGHAASETLPRTDR